MDKILRQWLSDLQNNQIKTELDWQNRNLKSINEIIFNIIDGRKILLEDDAEDVFERAARDAWRLDVEEGIRRFGGNPDALSPAEMEALINARGKRGISGAMETYQDILQKQSGTPTPREQPVSGERRKSSVQSGRESVIPSEASTPGSRQNTGQKLSTGAQGGLFAGFGVAGAADLPGRVTSASQYFQAGDNLKGIEDALKAGVDVSLMAHLGQATKAAASAATPESIKQAAKQARQTIMTEYSPAKAAAQVSKPFTSFGSKVLEYGRGALAPLYVGSEIAGVLSDQEKGKPGTETARRALEALPFAVDKSSLGQRGGAGSLTRGGARAALHGIKTGDPIEIALGGGLATAGAAGTIKQDTKTIKDTFKTVKEIIPSAKGVAQDVRSASFAKAVASGVEQEAADIAAKKAGSRAAIKQIGKGILQAGVKSIPGVNLAFAVPFAVTRAAEGDISGAGLELATAIPFLGLAAQGVLAYRDVQKALEQEEEKNEAQKRLKKAQGEVKDTRELMPDKAPWRPVKRGDIEKLAAKSGEIRTLEASPYRPTEEEKWEKRLGIPSKSDEELKVATNSPESFEQQFKREYGFNPVFENAMRAGLNKIILGQ